MKHNEVELEDFTSSRGVLKENSTQSTNFTSSHISTNPSTIITDSPQSDTVDHDR